MTSGATILRELTVPGSTLLHIRQILDDEMDSATVTRILYDTGFATGESVFDDFAASTDANPITFGHDRFWTDLGQFLSAHGWGNFSHERIHPGLGMVRTEQWGESSPASETSEPSCAFTSGMLFYCYHSGNRNFNPVVHAVNFASGRHVATKPSA